MTWLSADATAVTREFMPLVLYSINTMTYNVSKRADHSRQAFGVLCAKKKPIRYTTLA